MLKMNTTPPATGNAAGAGGCLIALGTNLTLPPGHRSPHDERLALLDATLHQIGISSVFSLQFIKAGLVLTLKAKGILMGTVELQGDFLDLLISFRTSDRAEAIATLQDFCQTAHMGDLFAIAWFDSSEQAWRLVKSGSFLGRFEEFTTEERTARRIAKMQQSLNESRALVEALLPFLQDGAPPPPSHE